MIYCPNCGLSIVISPFLIQEMEGHCALCGWHFQVVIEGGRTAFIWDDMFILAESEEDDDLS